MASLKDFLIHHKQKTVSLEKLEEASLSLGATYEDFCIDMRHLEALGVLQRIASKGQSLRPEGFGNGYRIHRHFLLEDHHKTLQKYRLLFHEAMDLSAYYALAKEAFFKDLPYLEKLNTYLSTQGLPEEGAPAPLRSYALVGNEKWIQEEGGKELLTRVGLYDALRIYPVADPLMFAIHPESFQRAHHLHLIVENKTTFEGLLPVLRETTFSTLLYGQGKAILKSIELFPLQCPLEGTHRFLYFGDLDREGILIYHLLRKRWPVALAVPFYEACLQKAATRGKTYQKENTEAMEEFFASFSPAKQAHIKALLEDDFYYPQEILTAKELQHLWRNTPWTT